MTVENLRLGVWKVTVEAGTHGKRRRRSETVHGTERVARARERAMRADLAAGTLAPDRRAPAPTVADVVDRYLDRYGDTLKPSVLAGYRSKLETLIRPALGDLVVDRIDPVVLEDAYRDLMAGRPVGAVVGRRRKRANAAGYSLNTIRNVHRIVRAACADAARTGYTTSNPAANVATRVLEGGATILEPIDPTGIARVLAVAARNGDADLAEIAQLAVATSARLGELAALRWRDVDLAVGIVRVYGSAHGRRRVVPKNGKPKALTVGPNTAQMLRGRYARQCAQARAAGVPVEALDDVAVCSRELEVDCTNPGTIGKRWSRAKTAAGVALRFHDLRHFAVSEMVGAGLSILDTANRAGHGARMTLEVYGHFAPAGDVAAGTILDDAAARIVAAVPDGA